MCNFKEQIGDFTWEKLMSRLKEVNNHIATRGIKKFEGHNLLTGYSYGEFYDWDLYFENIYLSYYGISQYCRANLETFLSKQLVNGFISRTLVSPRHHQHFKPFLVQIALLYCRQTKNYSWIEGKVLAQLEKYLDYWFWYCDLDKNGLSVWDSSDHSGMDNQIGRAGSCNSWTIEGVDLNCYLVRELQALSVIAGHLNQGQKEKACKSKAEKLWQTIDSVLWHEEDGFYYDRNERTGEIVRVKSIAGLIPLWLGLASKEKAERLINEHLLNPNEFWLEFPLAAWAKTEPDYDQDADDWGCNWRGTTWIPTNYMLMHGLMQYGYKDIAKKLAYKNFELALIKNEVTREYYNAETGEGKGLDPFWGWSALAYFMPLEYELNYNPMDIGRDEIIPIAQELKSCSLYINLL